MTEIKIDLSQKGVKIKPMNAVNNGPTAPSVRLSHTTFDAYKAANIPYARNHDASFFTGYGGEHTVDVHRIFKNFDADENNSENYIFEPTDEYIKTTLAAGTKIFYRLGASIEHGYKYGTRVPKDFAKWARICEHIIRHYNEGWANGFEYGIEYWEIWNEPDCRNRDGSNPCWQGTEEQFIELYATAANYLKEKFPNLKIGGPAFCGPWKGGFKDKFLDYVAQNNVTLDFYSFHWYGKTVEDIVDAFREGRNELDKRGLKKAETILNEWNYIKGWIADDWNYSLRMEKGLKGSSLIAGIMCAGQSEPIDMLMYYDARPCSMNGMFKQETYECLKGYYPFVMFDTLAKLGTQIPTEYSVENIYNCAATDGENHAVMLTHYNDDDNAPAKQVKLGFIKNGGALKASYYLLDETHNLTLMREETFTAENFGIYLEMPIHSSVLIKFEKM